MLDDTWKNFDQEDFMSKIILTLTVCSRLVSYLSSR